MHETLGRFVERNILPRVQRRQGRKNTLTKVCHHIPAVTIGSEAHISASTNVSVATLTSSNAFALFLAALRCVLSSSTIWMAFVNTSAAESCTAYGYHRTICKQ